MQEAKQRAQKKVKKVQSNAVAITLMHAAPFADIAADKLIKFLFRATFFHQTTLMQCRTVKLYKYVVFVIHLSIFAEVH